MPVPRIVFSKQARADLQTIEDYIAERDGEMRASAIRSKIDETMRRIAFAPGMGGSRSYLKPNERAFPMSPWTIYYEALPEMGGIYIVRVVDARRNLPVVFNKR